MSLRAAGALSDDPEVPLGAFLGCVPIFIHLAQASKRAGSPGYRGPAPAAPQRSLVAAACTPPAALSARPCQQFPRFLPRVCSSSCWRCGTCWHHQLCQHRVSAAPSPSSPHLLLRGRASTPSLLPPLHSSKHSQAHSHRRLETCTPSRLSRNSSSPASCSQGENFTSSAGWVAAAGVAPLARRS